MPENLTALHSRMLLEIFGVREEKRRPPVVSCMGRGYDIIHDEIKVSYLRMVDGAFVDCPIHVTGEEHLRLQERRLLRGRVRHPGAAGRRPTRRQADVHLHGGLRRRRDHL